MEKTYSIEIKRISPNKWLIFHIPVVMLGSTVPCFIEGSIAELIYFPFIFGASIAVLYLQVTLINFYMRLVDSGPALEIKEVIDQKWVDQRMRRK